MLYHYLSTVKAPAAVAEKVSNHNWQLIVDEAAGMKFTTFHKNKDDILDNTSAQLKAIERLAGKGIQAWRQDNAGENKAVEKNMVNEH